MSTRKDLPKIPRTDYVQRAAEFVEDLRASRTEEECAAIVRDRTELAQKRLRKFDRFLFWADRRCEVRIPNNPPPPEMLSHDVRKFVVETLCFGLRERGRVFDPHIMAGYKELVHACSLKELPAGVDPVQRLQFAEFLVQDCLLNESPALAKPPVESIISKPEDALQSAFGIMIGNLAHGDSMASISSYGEEGVARALQTWQVKPPILTPEQKEVVRARSASKIERERQLKEFWLKQDGPLAWNRRPDAKFFGSRWGNCGTENRAAWLVEKAKAFVSKMPIDAPVAQAVCEQLDSFDPAKQLANEFIISALRKTGMSPHQLCTTIGADVFEMERMPGLVEVDRDWPSLPTAHEEQAEQRELFAFSPSDASSASAAVDHVRSTCPGMAEEDVAEVVMAACPIRVASLGLDARRSEPELA